MPKLIQLIFFSETGEVNRRALFVLIASLVAGLAYAALAALVNEAAEEVLLNESAAWEIPLFLFMLAFFLVSKRVSLSSGVVLAEEVLEKYRNRVGDLIRRSGLARIEELDKGDIYARLTLDAKQISRSFSFGIKFFQALVTIAAVFFYIFFLSFKTGFFLAAVMAFGWFYFRLKRKKLDEAYHAAFRSEESLFEDFGHALEGFKELKLNRGKSEDFYKNHLAPLLEKTKELRISVGNEFAGINAVVFVVLFYLSLGCALFILSKDMPLTLNFKIIAVFAFIWEPVNVINAAVPEIVRGNVSAERVMDMKAKLEDSAPSDDIPPGRALEFKTLSCETLSFHYPGKEGREAFSVGPIDLAVNRGEMVFLTGGNGSGKSTFLKLLAGLYEPSGGAFFIDGSRVPLRDQRRLFSAVFADCHLFDELYGLEKVSEKKARDLIAMMGLEGKASIENTRILHSGLSAGQTKRLALVVALLEDRPVCLFDEWAAEQDPRFRKTFYERILPSLKSEGKTIVAATHDDRYFHVADRVVKMDFGKIEKTWERPS
ncbi:ABC transporter ATP-binding protein yojI [Candidatus Desulfarcum epimagneticum]|uniref:ABC transporter ATP-binding protein yojI n=1 Tax=uncultured Desulfobacteraceae bacterium TaxID=218296 RepID=A0A484HEP9_9BACT|nr:ABC transporter ATP-binding protein yojI [uncultured Desulfobacteraceae bacterium]